MNTTGSEMPSSTGSLLEFSSDDDVDDKYTHTHHADASQNDDGRQSSIRQRMEREKQELLVRWRQENEQSRVVNRLPTIYLPDAIDTCCTNAEVVLSNMPLTIGAVGLSWVSLGVVWFKFMEETAGVCHPRRYHDAACTYSEFPGCFECDTSNHYYKAALTFHTVCNGVGAVCALLFLCKVILAWQVVADELKNPATATPVGVVCITVVCVAAGRGLAGEAIVIATSIFHVLLAFWFLYTAIVQFRLLPDPGWFPNTVGISYAAVKTWLYFPAVGKVLLALAMAFFFATYFISLYRVFTNHKIAAPVCFIQLSAPSIVMYAMTILAQPSYYREQQLEASHDLLVQYFQVHHDWYMPTQHFMMILSLIGMVSVLHSLWARWTTFRKHRFSPAHMAFVFPLLSHANAVQAYRSGVNTFSGIPEGNPFKIVLFSYWVALLIAGSVVNFVFTAKYIRRLPEWTKVDIGDEEEPVPPSETMVHEMLVESDVHETMRNHTLVSPALLQANEAGSLVRVRQGSRRGPFVRTRKVTALGFDFIMSELELREGRAELLDWVAKHAPRTRSRTLSIPMMMKLKGKNGRDMYGTFGTGRGFTPQKSIHKRSATLY